MMNISRATFYYKPQNNDQDLKDDLELIEKIKSIHKVFPGYGYRRIYQHLLREDIRVNSKRLRRVIKKYHLWSSRKKLIRPKGSTSVHQLYYPNLIAGMNLTAPDQVWAVDITYIKLHRQYFYLNAIIDIYTRKIIGWSLSNDLGHKFCLEALKVAIRNRKPQPGVIHHSDRGTQYTSDVYVGFLKQNGFQISMSKPGSPKENAFIESFFKTLKIEEVYVKNYNSQKDILRHLPKFIDDVYNLKRLHSSLGYKSPEEYEIEIMKLKPAERPVQKIWQAV